MSPCAWPSPSPESAPPGPLPHPHESLAMDTGIQYWVSTTEILLLPALRALLPIWEHQLDARPFCGGHGEGAAFVRRWSTLRAPLLSAPHIDRLLAHSRGGRALRVSVRACVHGRVRLRLGGGVRLSLRTQTGRSPTPVLPLRVWRSLLGAVVAGARGGMLCRAPPMPSMVQNASQLHADMRTPMRAASRPCCAQPSAFMRATFCAFEPHFAQWASGDAVARTPPPPARLRLQSRLFHAQGVTTRSLQATGGGGLSKSRHPD